MFLRGGHPLPHLHTYPPTHLPTYPPPYYKVWGDKWMQKLSKVQTSVPLGLSDSMALAVKAATDMVQ